MAYPHPPISYQQAAAMSERVYYPPEQRGRYYATSTTPWAWTIPPDQNKRDWCVWVERRGIPGEEKAVLAFRGTSLEGLGELAKLKLGQGFVKTAKDLIADGDILLGRFQESDRFRNALAVAKRVVAKYGPDRTTMVGHSLGGRVAIDCALATGAWCIAFSAGYSPFDPVRSGRGPRIRSFAARNDIVAAAAVADGGAWPLSSASGHGVGQFEAIFAPPSTNFSPHRFELP